MCFPRWTTIIMILATVRVARAQSPLPDAAAGAVIPQSISLADAERLLLDRSLALASTRALVTAAQAARQIAGFKPNPTVLFGAEQFPFASPLPGTVPRFFSTDSNAGAQPTYTVQFSKVFERGGKREFRVEQADATIEAARLQVLDTLRNQLFQLRQAFGTALLARENLRLAESIRGQYDRTEQLTIVKVQAGDFAQMELYRVRAGRLQYAAAVIDARNSYSLATRDLLNLLNASPSDVSAQPGAPMAGVGTIGSGQAPSERPGPEIVGDFIEAPVTRSLTELRALSLTTRPDVQIAHQNLIAADRGVDLARAQRTRDVSASLEYQRIGDDHSVGVMTQVPLFLYNNQRAGIAQAEAQRRSALALLQQAERQATTDVEKAYQSYLAAREALMLYSTENVIQITRLQNIAEFTFRQGSTSLFELLEVQRNTRQTLMAYNQARAAYQLSVWQLEQAVGATLF